MKNDVHRPGVRAGAHRLRDHRGGSASGLSAVVSALNTTGAVGSGGSKTENQVGAAVDVFKAVTVSDEELKSVALQYRAYGDRTEKLAPPNNKYAQRLERLTRKHVNEDGLQLNFKVYLSKDVNANATADGSIRVYAGLMDMMNDQELLGVIGHEIGHVKHAHTMSAMRTAYMASAGRKAVAPPAARQPNWPIPNWARWAKRYSTASSRKARKPSRMTTAWPSCKSTSTT